MRSLIAFIAALAVATPVAADDPSSVGIVAVVNDQVISTLDLSDRIELAMGTTGIPDTPENRAHVAPQLLRQLVDEKLEMQEATKDGITISDAKLHEGIAEIEKQGGRPPGSLEALLESKGLSKQSFYAQVRAQMAWSEIVVKKIRPKIRISDQEVARYVKRSKAAPPPAASGVPGALNGQQEVLIAALHLPVDSPQSEAGMRKLAEKLAGEIRSGAKFEAVAAQFSSSTGDTKASDPFWVDLSQMDPLISAALMKTPKGGITAPIRTATGYQIVKFIDIRQAHGAPAAASAEAPAATVSDVPEAPRVELAYKQILMSLKPDAKPKEAQLLLQLANEVKQSPGKCEEKSMAGAGDLADMDFQVSLQRALSTDLSPKLRDLLLGLKVGAVSQPVITPQGIHLFMLCERIDLPPTNVPSAVADDAVRQSIYEEKLELEAQKYLLGLRREAFIEIHKT